MQLIKAPTLVGANLSTSIITFPALLQAQTPTLVKQWHVLYNSGITPVVGLAVTGSAGFAALAYRAASAPGHNALDGGLWAKRNLYIAAAVMTFSLTPYTWILMWDTIQELERRAKSTPAVKPTIRGRRLASIASSYKLQHAIERNWTWWVGRDWKYTMGKC